MNWYLGTMGFGYSDWEGAFYPTGMPSRKYLSYYSRVFNSVEIDSTFYGTPNSGTVQRWKSATPEGFIFSLKTPKLITHDMGLSNSVGLMEEFLERVRLLGDKLGVVLLQFPPTFDIQNIELLDRFLAELPDNIRFAIEVRHQSWYTAKQEFTGLLKKYSVCWAATKYPGLPDQINETTDIIYIRWIGRHGSYIHHNREKIDRTSELKKWLGQINELSDTIVKLYGFFNNDYAGFGVGTAENFMRIAGLPVVKSRPPQQRRLF